MEPYSTSVVADPLSDVVLAVGDPGFGMRVTDAVCGLVRPDIVGAYFLDADQAMRVLFTGGGLPGVPRFPETAANHYVLRFWKQDPAVSRLLGRDDQSAIV